MTANSSIVGAANSYTVVYSRGAEELTVAHLRTSKDAERVSDILTIKGALDANQDLTTLQLHSLQLEPSFRLEAAASAALRHISCSELAQQLQTCFLTGATPLHTAASSGSVAVVHALLVVMAAAAASAVMARDREGNTPLHAAAEHGHADSAQLLVAAAPGAAVVRNGTACRTPLFAAAASGHASVVAVLLGAAPGTAFLEELEFETGWYCTPLHAAAAEGHAAVVELLLAAAPQTAVQAAKDGTNPLHAAATGGHVEAAWQLVAAAPTTAKLAAVGASNTGDTPLHEAAARGDSAVIQLLLDAAPEAAAATNASRLTPLGTALRNRQATARGMAVHCLLPATPTAVVLSELASAGAAGLCFYPDAIAARLPLSAAEWAMLPASCPGLGRALPAVLAHSPAQARQLVHHLPAADLHRLQTFALCLQHEQARWGVWLPTDVVWHQLLARFEAAA